MYTRTRHRKGVVVGITVLAVLITHLFFADTLRAQVSSSDILAHRERLEQELSEVEAEIEAQQVLLQEKQRERVSLERDVAIITAKIDKARLDIRARDLVIQGLSREIGQKEDTIGGLNEKLVRAKESLAQLIRRTHEIDEFSMVEVVLGNRNLSDFFEELDAFNAIEESLQVSFVDIEVTKEDTQEQKETLEGKKNDQLELRRLQVLQKQQIETQEGERKKILDVTKGQETAYQNFIASKEQTAAEIRAQLFVLRDSAPIPFAEALGLAQFASAQTGVRPAFILGVLSQETNLGANLGTGTWRVDMHPTRDRPLFEIITRTLGFDPNRMPVSKRPGYGWGGAMGPAQFIPSTWGCYSGYIHGVSGRCTPGKGNSWSGPWSYDPNKDRIRQAVGKNSPANPWENKDAFTASALLLRDNGAAKGGYTNERLAALRYFAGWTNATNPAYGFYGDGVMELAAKWQRQINVLQGGA